MKGKTKSMKERIFEGIVFGIDFDGTVVSHSFPEIGIDAPNVHQVLGWIVKNGGKLVLNTMRSDRADRDYLTEAANWFEFNDIPLYGINENPTQKNWTGSPKVYAHIYIDDAALGCPLMYNEHNLHRPCVDWLKVRKMLLKNFYKVEPIINGSHIVTE